MQMSLEDKFAELLDLLTSSMAIHPGVNSGESEETPVGLKCRDIMPFFLFGWVGFLLFLSTLLYFFFTWSCPQHSLRGYRLRHAAGDGAEFPLTRLEPGLAAPQRCCLVLCQVPKPKAGK